MVRIGSYVFGFVRIDSHRFVLVPYWFVSVRVNSYLAVFVRIGLCRSVLVRIAM